MKRLEIIVSGRVQGVGYRGFATVVGTECDVTGFSENLPDGSVKIVAEGNEGSLMEFVSLLWAKDEPVIMVKGIEITEQNYIGEFSSFEAHFDDFQSEMFRRSGLGLEYMKEIIKLQEQSLKLQEELLDAVRGVSDETINQRETLERVIEAIHTRGFG